MTESISLVVRAVERFAVHATGRRVLVGYSGGVDSHALLYELSRQSITHSIRLVALHADHQLLSGSPSWELQCREYCRKSDIEYRSCKLKLDSPNSGGTENAARKARYAWFRNEMRPGDLIVTGHHLDDQVETVLFRLLRGSGVRGLTGIPPSSHFGIGQLVRPFRDLWRNDIEVFARAQELDWIVDPSNFDLSYDRNFLRERVIPLFQSRWSAGARSIVRTSRHMTSAETLLIEIGCADLERAKIRPSNCLFRNHGKIPISLLIEYSPERAVNLLRNWCHLASCDAPRGSQLLELFRQICTAKESNRIELRWKSAEFRCYRRDLYLLPKQIHMDTPASRILRPYESLDVAEVGLRVTPVRILGVGIRCSSGGSTEFEIVWNLKKGVRPTPKSRTRSLRNLFQENSIPPWERKRIPIVCIAGRIVCVPGVAIASEFAAGPNEMGVNIRLEELA